MSLDPISCVNLSSAAPLLARGVPGGLTAIWSRERLSGVSADVVHCHMLFHLTPALHLGKNYVQVDTALRRLVERTAISIYGDFAVDLRTHPDPDGRYLIKGGGRDVWEQFRIRKEWRKPQGMIFGKRCGATENIGLIARKRHGMERANLAA